MENPQWVSEVLYDKKEVRGSEDREPSGDSGGKAEESWPLVEELFRFRVAQAVVGRN